MVFWGLLGVAVCQILAPKAVGSGVPQVKTVLSGIKIYKFLEFKLLIAKIIGLVCSATAGVGTGREGPFIHMAAMYAYNLSQLKIFKTLGTVKINLF